MFTSTDLLTTTWCHLPPWVDEWKYMKNQTNEELGIPLGRWMVPINITWALLNTPVPHQRYHHWMPKWHSALPPQTYHQPISHTTWHTHAIHYQMCICCQWCHNQSKDITQLQHLLTLTESQTPPPLPPPLIHHPTRTMGESRQPHHGNQDHTPHNLTPHNNPGSTIAHSPHLQTQITLVTCLCTNKQLRHARLQHQNKNNCPSPTSHTTIQKHLIKAHIQNAQAHAQDHQPHHAICQNWERSTPSVNCHWQNHWQTQTPQLLPTYPAPYISQRMDKIFHKWILVTIQWCG